MNRKLINEFITYRWAINVLDSRKRQVHVCLFEKKPRKVDVDSLKDELAESREFGLVGQDLIFQMAELDEPVVSENGELRCT